MANCIITRLDTVLTDPNLPKFGHIYLPISNNTQLAKLVSSKPITVNIINGTFVQNNASIGTTITATQSNPPYNIQPDPVIVCVSDGSGNDLVLDINDQFGLTGIDMRNNTQSFSLDALCAGRQLDYLALGGCTGVTGNGSMMYPKISMLAIDSQHITGQAADYLYGSASNNTLTIDSWLGAEPFDIGQYLKRSVTIGNATSMQVIYSAGHDSSFKINGTTYTVTNSHNYQMSYNADTQVMTITNTVPEQWPFATGTVTYDFSTDTWITE